MKRKTEAKKGKPWTPAEQAGAVIAYNAMLAADQSGQPYSKAAINRYLRGDWPEAEYEGEPRPQFDKDAAHAHAISLPPLAQRILHARSRGSVEAKWMNISACREKLALALLPGYKAAGNYQQSLLDAVKAAEPSQPDSERVTGHQFDSVAESQQYAAAID